MQNKPFKTDYVTLPVLRIGAKIIIGNVEGKTDVKGAKQNKTYEITEQSISHNWYKAQDAKGKLFTLWINEHSIGISKGNNVRMSSCTEFNINTNDYIEMQGKAEYYKGESKKGEFVYILKYLIK